MRYNLLEIVPGDNGDWVVRINPSDKAERVNSKQRPHPLGFYYCPSTIPIKDGMEELRQLLVSKHEREIFSLKASLRELQTLSFGNMEQIDEQATSVQVA